MDGSADGSVITDTDASPIYLSGRKTQPSTQARRTPPTGWTRSGVRGPRPITPNRRAGLCHCTFSTRRTAGGSAVQQRLSV